MGYIASLLKGIVYGIVLLTVIVMSLSGLVQCMGQAQAGETYTIEKSHQGLRVTSNIGHTNAGEINPTYLDMLLIYRGDDGIPVMYHVDKNTRKAWCADSNAYLRALKDLIDTQESTDGTYDEAYLSIQRAWCKP